MQTPQTSEGQAGAALGAAAGQDLTAIGGPHPLAEAVLLGALALLGLIGTEHLHTPPVFISAPGLRPRATRRRADIAASPRS